MIVVHVVRSCVDVFTRRRDDEGPSFRTQPTLVRPIGAAQSDTRAPACSKKKKNKSAGCQLYVCVEFAPRRRRGIARARRRQAYSRRACCATCGAWKASARGGGRGRRQTRVCPALGVSFRFRRRRGKQRTLVGLVGRDVRPDAPGARGGADVDETGTRANAATRDAFATTPGTLLASDHRARPARLAISYLTLTLDYGRFVTAPPLADPASSRIPAPAATGPLSRQSHA